jgi:hypothetical protein
VGEGVRAAFAAGLLLAGCLATPGMHSHTETWMEVDVSWKDASGTVVNSTREGIWLGTGQSNLGLEIEEALRTHSAGDEVAFTVQPFAERVQVNRFLPDLPVNQSAGEGPFASAFGNASEGLEFTAYGFYQGRVTSIVNGTVYFQLKAEHGQRDDVPEAGVVVLTNVTGDRLRRVLLPQVGAVFVVVAEGRCPSTPLDLRQGTYRTLGSSETAIVFGRAPTTDVRLAGQPLRAEVRILQVDQRAGPPPECDPAPATSDH